LETIEGNMIILINAFRFCFQMNTRSRFCFQVFISFLGACIQFFQQTENLQINSTQTENPGFNTEKSIQQTENLRIAQTEKQKTNKIKIQITNQTFNPGVGRRTSGKRAWAS
jgi:ABC-type uncharacterized transport system auxiliary subunit